MKHPFQSNADIFHQFEQQLEAQSRNEKEFRIMKRINKLFNAGWNINKIVFEEALDELFGSRCLGIDIENEYKVSDLLKPRTNECKLVKNFLDARKRASAGYDYYHMIVCMQGIRDRFIITDYGPSDTMTAEKSTYVVLNTENLIEQLFLTSLFDFSVMNDHLINEIVEEEE